MRSLATAGLVLLVGLAACLSEPAQVPCEGADCPGPSPSPAPEWVARPPGSPFPPVPVNESLRSMRLEGCVGIGANLYMNYAKVDERVPDDFELQELEAGHARFVMTGLRCERAILPNQIIPGYQELFLGPFVYAKNASWQAGERVGHYLFEHLVSVPAAATFLNSVGIPATVGAFRIEETQILSSTTYQWTVEQNNTRFSFEYVTTDLLGDSSNGTSYRWTGLNPYLRATRTSDYESRGPSVDYGVMRAEGPSRTAEAMDGPAAYWDGGFYHKLDQSIVIDPELFGGGTG